MSEKTRDGVCCECQSVHPLRTVSDKELDDSGFARDYDDDSIGKWVLADHDAYGSHCDGSGTMPQTLVAEKSSDFESYMKSLIGWIHEEGPLEEPKISEQDN